MKKVLFCSIIIVVFVFGFSMSCFAYTEPSFPGFPQGPAYLIDNELNQQWIHNTPYGGFLVRSSYNGVVAEYRIIRIQNVTFSRYTITYEFDIIGYSADYCDIFIPYWVDPSLPSYSVGVDVSCDAPVWSSQNFKIPYFHPGIDPPYYWYTYKSFDSISPSGVYSTSSEFVPSSGLNTVWIQCLNFTDNTPYHCTVTFLYCEPFGSSSPAPSGSLDFWHLGQNTNFTSLSSTVHTIHASSNLGEVYRTVTGFISDSPFHIALLWLICGVSALSMLYELIFHG